MFRVFATSFAAALVLGAGIVHGGTVIELIGDPALAVQPGDTGGWGLSVNSTDAWVVFTGSNFAPSTALGIYTDYLSGPNFFFGVLGSATLDEFDPINVTGAGQFAVDPGAALGTSVTGILQIFWDAYSVSPEDPDFDPGSDLVSSGNIETFDVSVTAGAEEVPVVTPEPRSFWLVGVSVAMLLGWRKPRLRPSLILLALLGASTLVRAQNVQVVPTNPSTDEKKVLNIIRNAGLPGIGPNCRADSNTLDDSGCCGSPGHFGCSTISDSHRTASFCTDPGSNNLRLDSFSKGDLAGFDFAGDIVCELPQGTCDTGLADSINGTSKAGVQDFTFYSTSDLHFFRKEWWVENQIRHVAVLNTLSTYPLFWPGSPSERIGAPLGVVIAGDMTLNAGRSELASFRLLWERNRVGASIAYPTFLGLGNHDITGINGGNVNPAQIINDPKRLLYYLYDRMNCGGVRLDPKINGVPASGNYSWDYGRLHLVMLNTWAGDQNNQFSHPGDGLAWLKQDLATNVAATGLPVVIFEHYPFSSITSNPSTTSATNISDFWDAIKDYNVIGFFAGHTHVSSVLRVETDLGAIQTDSADKVKLFDTFRSGTGGQEGQGDVLAIRYTEDSAHLNAFLDVATVAWDNVNGVRLVNPDRLPVTEELANGIEGSGYYGNVPGCHKRVNTRFNDVSSLVTLSSVPGANGTSAIVTIKRTPSSPLFPDSSAGPNPVQFALALNNLTDQLSGTPNFVNSCTLADPSITGSIPNVTYVQLTDQQVLDLNAGKSTQVVLAFAFVPGTYNVGLTALTPIHGSSPFSLELLIGADATPATQLFNPPVQNFTAYGEPGGPVTLTAAYTQPAVFGQGWITFPAGEPAVFDKFGRASISFNVDTTKLNTTSDGQPVATIHVNQNPAKTPDLFENAAVAVSLTFKPVTTMTLLSVTPASNYNPASGLPAIFKAKLTHPTLANNAAVDGIASLSDAVLDTQGHVLSTHPITSVRINNPEACSDIFENVDADLKPAVDNVVFGDVGNSGIGPNIVQGYCPSGMPGSLRTQFRSGTIPVGLHHFVVEYAGNSSYAPAVSLPFDYLVARPLGSLTITGGSGQGTLAGTTFTQSLAVKVLDNGTLPAPGIPVTFTAPAAGATGFFPGGVSTVSVMTGADGIATAPPFTASVTAGSYQVVAATGGLPPVNLQLTNVAMNAGPPVVVAAIASRAGALSARQWTLRITNTGGFASAVQVASLTVTPVQTGTSCVPKLVTPLPVAIGGVPNGVPVLGSPITLDFSTCTSTTRFTVTVGISGQSLTTSTTLGNQFP